MLGDGGGLREGLGYCGAWSGVVLYAPRCYGRRGCLCAGGMLWVRVPVQVPVGRCECFCRVMCSASLLARSLALWLCQRRVVETVVCVCEFVNLELLFYKGVFVFVGL